MNGDLSRFETIPWSGFLTICDATEILISEDKMVEKGFNSDFNIKGKSYHVQTEDWGVQNPFIVTRIFCNGAVQKTIKTPYSEVLKSGPASDAEGIRLALRRQHHRAIELLHFL